MARYIDADKFKSQLERAMEKMHLIGGVKAVDVGAVIQALDRQPTADVVEVVRCRECKYWGGITFGYVCNAWSGMSLKHYTKPTGYCSYGERKEQT